MNMLAVSAERFLFGGLAPPPDLPTRRTRCARSVAEPLHNSCKSGVSSPLNNPELMTRSANLNMDDSVTSVITKLRGMVLRVTHMPNSLTADFKSYYMAICTLIVIRGNT